MRLISAGAARTVTGSCHLIQTAGRRILIDCGMFQGKVEELNREPFPFEPGEIDAVLLTHAHLDHAGRLPRLVKQGYKGPIHTLRSTRLIAEVILLDSAKIQTEDYERAIRHAEQSEDEKKIEEPLYTDGDVANTLALIHEIGFDTPLDLGSNVRATFRPAGHILGSAFIELEGPDGRLAASGDLGNRESAIQQDAARPRECDFVLIETTYADRTHRSLAETLAEFRSVLERSTEAGGNVMIPSFALERTQTVLYHLKNLMQKGEIPRMPVYLDSPMAARMTRLYQQCANEFLPEIAQALARGEDPFEPETLEYTVRADESRKINEIEGGAIIIAGSGMMTGGRIVHHLKHNLWRKQASLVVVGYQAEGTLGRRIVDGADEVRIHGDEIPVRAHVSTINGFSSHADRDDLLWWLETTGKAQVFLVHGEEEVMNEFTQTLAGRGREATAVVRDQTYDLEP
ncbi:MAG: MBL fold metallo-hydrolase [Gemmatimonadetes bacterium]|nr:MBL fold metallo-hydrolase [Gemmatimonadota bacterium]